MSSKKGKTQTEQQVDMVKDYQDVFGSKAGVRVLQDMMSHHYLMSSTYTGDTTQMYIREGERNAVLRILALIKMNVNQLKERIDNDAEIRSNETIV